MRCETVKGCAAFVASAGWVTAASMAWFSGAGHVAWLLLLVGLAASCTAIFGMSLLSPHPKQAQRAAYDAGWRDGRRAERMINGHSAHVIQLRRRTS